MKSYPISKLIKNLPKTFESFCFNKSTAILSFVLPITNKFFPDANKSITVSINVLNGEAWWKGNDIETQGDYHKIIEDLKDFKEAMELFNRDIDYWLDNYDEEAIYND